MIRCGRKSGGVLLLPVTRRVLQRLPHRAALSHHPQSQRGIDFLSVIAVGAAAGRTL